MSRSRGWVGAIATVALATVGGDLWGSHARGGLTAVSSAIVAAGQTGNAPAALPRPIHDDPRIVTDAERTAAISRAHVWRAPATPVGKADFGADATTPAELSCRFRLTELGGTTPKFDCDLETGEGIRVRYGRGPEIPAEAAATRLLRGLGFGADTVVIVEQLRCYGCPDEPFSVTKTLEITHTASIYARMIDYTDYEEFKWVAVERKFPARPIETANLEGWPFHDLRLVDTAKGGAPREHLDAVRLVAVLLAHWDNKSENQRLVCLSDPWPEGTPCTEPFLLLQDVGATFGPSKVDLSKWEKVPIWKSRETCEVSMDALPYSGATFGKATITEAGRQFTVRLLQQLSERQLTDLFSAARFDKQNGWFFKARPAHEWARAFNRKVRAIAEGPPCPADQP